MYHIVKANSSYSSLLVLQPHRECVYPTVRCATAGHKHTQQSSFKPARSEISRVMELGADNKHAQ